MATAKETRSALYQTAQIPTYPGVVRDGQIRLLGNPPLPDGARVLVTVVARGSPVEMGELSAAELASLAAAGGSFDWLAEEPELYSDADLQERFEWTR